MFLVNRFTIAPRAPVISVGGTLAAICPPRLERIVIPAPWRHRAAQTCDSSAIHGVRAHKERRRRILVAKRKAVASRAKQEPGRGRWRESEAEVGLVNERRLGSGGNGQPPTRPRSAQPPLLGVAAAAPAARYRAVQPRRVLRAARNARRGVVGRARSGALPLPGHPPGRRGLRAPAARQPRRRAGAVAARDLLPRPLPRGLHERGRR